MTTPLFQLDGWTEGQLPPELAQTYTKLKIQVDKTIVSRVNNRIINSLSDTLYLPVYPVAEWIVANWWRLLYDCNNLRVDNNYDETHNLKFAGEGYFLPDLTIVPDGEDVLLKWQPYSINDNTLAFIEYGGFVITRHSLQYEFENFVSSVILRLQNRGIVNTPLQDDWNAICASRDNREEYNFCIACARLGMDPYDIEEPIADTIIAVNEQIGTAINTEEVFSATDCCYLESTAGQLQALLDDMPKIGFSPIFQNIYESCSKIRELTPWKTGYAQANVARKIMKEEGVSIQNLPNLILERTNKGSMPSGIRSLVANDTKSGPGFMAHDLEHLKPFVIGRMLAGFCGMGNRAVPVTEVYTAEQKRQRAFAAELFAPAAELRYRLQGQTLVGEDTLEELAMEYQLNTTAIKHQLENHQIARVV